MYNWLYRIKSIPRNWKNVLCPWQNFYRCSRPNKQCKPLYILQNCVPKTIETISETSNRTKVIGKNAPTGRCRLEQYLLPRATTIESSSRSFQYKILNNTLYSDERLFKLNAVESPLCSLRRQVPESVLHLFCTCSVTRNLWVQFCLWPSNANIILASDLDP